MSVVTSPDQILAKFTIHTAWADNATLHELQCSTEICIPSQT